MRRCFLGIVAGGVLASACSRYEWTLPEPLLTCEPAPGEICSLGFEGIGDGGEALSASLAFANSLAFAPDGSVIVSDSNNARLRRIDTNGIITTIAGTGGATGIQQTGTLALSAPITAPAMITVCPDGDVLWHDHRVGAIYELAAGSDSIQRVAGTGMPGGPVDDVLALDAAFNFGGEGSISCGADGNVLIADQDNGLFRYWNRGASATTLAGRTVDSGHIVVVAGTIGAMGTGVDDVPATSSALMFANDGVVLPDRRLLIADSNNNRVRVVGSDGIVHRLAGTGVGASNSGDGGPALSATIRGAAHIAVEPQANVLFIGTFEDVVRIVNLSTSASTTWGGLTLPPATIETIAGRAPPGYGLFGDGGPATEQWLHLLERRMTAAPDGALWIADVGNSVIRRVDPDTGDMSVVAGFAGYGTLEDTFVRSAGIAIDPASGGLRVVARNGHLWSVDPVNGAREILAGNGSPERSGDNGPALDAGFYGNDVEVAPDGTVYVADLANYVIRAIDGDGTIRTIAGSGTQGPPQGSGDGGDALLAGLAGPVGVTLDSSGNLIVVDGDRVAFINIGSSDASVLGNTVAPGTIRWIGGTGLPSGACNDAPGFGVPESLACGFDFGDQVAHPVVQGRDLYVGAYVAPYSKIFRIDLDTGSVTLVAGGGVTVDDGSLPMQTQLVGAVSLRIHDGLLYWSDGSSIRRTALDGLSPVTTIAGSRANGFFGDGGPATAASLTEPLGFVIASDGTIYVSDAHRIRKIGALP